MKVIRKFSGGLNKRCCPDCGSVHDVNDWPDNHRRWNEVLCAPAVIRDGMDEIFHPNDSQMYDSKSNFRRTTRAFGGEEVGNEKQKDQRWVNDVTPDDLGRAKQMVDQGYKPSLMSEGAPL